MHQSLGDYLRISPAQLTNNAEILSWHCSNYSQASWEFLVMVSLLSCKAAHLVIFYFCFLKLVLLETSSLYLNEKSGLHLIFSPLDLFSLLSHTDYHCKEATGKPLWECMGLEMC